jgi:GT2 family glycosyltransferase
VSHGDTSFSIVIPTYRRPEALQATLAALADVDYPREQVEVLVVDDGPDPATASIVDAIVPRLPQIRLLAQRNAGAAAARNLGAASATRDVLVFLDDDMLVAPDHLRQHEEARAQFGECVVNGHWEFPDEMADELRRTPFGRFRLEVEEWVKAGIAMEPLAPGYRAPVSVTACNLALGRELFQSLGGFDASFPDAGAEDQDLALRARRAGVQFVYADAIRLRHNDGRLTFRAYCERQRRGAASAAVLARKHPDEFGARPLIAENGPIRRGDGAPRIAKKIVKRALSTRLALATLHAVIDVLERAAPLSRMLRRAYWSVTGLYIYRGILGVPHR